MSKGSIDCIIVCHPKDKDILDICIGGIKKNIMNVNRIFCISKEKLHNDVIYINEEKNFPFTFSDIEEYVGKGNARTGWYYQQLLKLYSPRILNLQKFVIVDADTVFLNNVNFFDENDKIQFNTGVEYHFPYFEHMNRVFPGLVKQIDKSGICHCIPYTIELLNDLFDKIEDIHKLPLWRCMMKCIDVKHMNGSGMSEYELMFNFALKYHSHKINIKQLNWTNRGYMLKKDIHMYHYVSIHSYLRK